MEFIKGLLARIWALWGLVIFTATLMIVVWPITFTFLIPEPKGVKAFKAISKVWMTFFLYSIGCRVVLKGKENYSCDEEFVVTCNHRSLMDVPLVTPFFPGPNKTIAKKSMSRIPFFGWIYTRGSVLVDRSSDASRKRSYDAMKAVLLREKLNMAIYPEGTRNRTGKPLKSFYDGAFRLATDCRKRIIPVVMFNTDKVLPTNKFFYLWPSKLEMHLLPPVDSIGKSTAMLKEEVFESMWRYYEKHESAS